MRSFPVKSSSLWQWGGRIALWGFRLISNFLVYFQSIFPDFEQRQWGREASQPHATRRCTAYTDLPMVWLSLKEGFVNLTNKNKSPPLSVGSLPESHLRNSTKSLDDICSTSIKFKWNGVTCFLLGENQGHLWQVFRAGHDCFLMNLFRDCSWRPGHPAPSVHRGKRSSQGVTSLN